MQDILSMLSALQRPRLLMRAARHGAADYRRDIHLPRIMGYGKLPRYGAALMQLMETESALNSQRLSNDSAYSVTRHIDVLIAIVAEAHIMRTAQATSRGSSEAAS